MDSVVCFSGTCDCESDVYNCTPCYAAVPTGRITGRVCPSVTPSVCRVRAPNSKTKWRRKTEIRVYVRQDRRHRYVSFQLKTSGLALALELPSALCS